MIRKAINYSLFEEDTDEEDADAAADEDEDGEGHEDPPVTLPALRVDTLGWVTRLQHTQTHTGDQRLIYHTVYMYMMNLFSRHHWHSYGFLDI